MADKLRVDFTEVNDTPRLLGRGFVYKSLSATRGETKSHITILFDGGETFCTCEGYQFRKACKHIEAVTG